MPQGTTVGVKACDYLQHDNGIHIYTFNRASREALDQHFEMLETLVASTPGGAILRVLLDFRPAGFPPITYAFQRVRAMNSRFPQRAALCIAFVHRPNVLTSVVQSMVQLLRSDDPPARFFPPDKYDEAIAWLSQDRTISK